MTSHFCLFPAVMYGSIQPHHWNKMLSSVLTIKISTFPPAVEFCIDFLGPEWFYCDSSKRCSYTAEEMLHCSSLEWTSQDWIFKIAFPVNMNVKYNFTFLSVQAVVCNPVQQLWLSEQLWLMSRLWGTAARSLTLDTGEANNFFKSKR